jgi:caffeoyl-CoA O-methyltransferase
MEKIFGQNDQAIAEYAEKLFRGDDAVLEEINIRAVKNGIPDIQVGVMDGNHLEVLTHAFGVLKAVEIGTLAGYSGVCIARGLKPGGKLYTFEVNEKNAEVAKESFKKAGVSDRVELSVGPALEKLAEIEKFGPFDLVFIDADKVSYPDYLKWASKNLRMGGVVLGDNTFAWGQVAEKNLADDANGKSVKAIQKFNETCALSGEFKATVLPTGEGLTLAVKIRS